MKQKVSFFLQQRTFREDFIHVITHWSMRRANRQEARIWCWHDCVTILQIIFQLTITVGDPGKGDTCTFSVQLYPADVNPQIRIR